MKNTSKCLRRHNTMAVLALVTVTGLLTTSAFAKKGSDKATETATVIAHLPLEGPAVSTMFLQDQGNKHYLYIQQGPKEGFTVVDVSKPQQPNVIRREAWRGTTEPGGKFQMVGGGIALAETPDSSDSSSSRHEVVPANASGKHTESVRILDLSDPKNPKTLQTFQGVTSILADDTRKLIYITNGEGLWVLRHKHVEPEPVCDSESVFSPIANCNAY